MNYYVIFVCKFENVPFMEMSKIDFLNNRIINAATKYK